MFVILHHDENFYCWIATKEFLFLCMAIIPVLCMNFIIFVQDVVEILIRMKHNKSNLNYSNTFINGDCLEMKC